MNLKRAFLFAVFALPVSLAVVSYMYAPDHSHSGNAKEYAGRAADAERVVFQSSAEERGGILLYFQLWKNKTEHELITIKVNSTHPFCRALGTAAGEYFITYSDSRVDSPASEETDGSYLDISPKVPEGGTRLIGLTTRSQPFHRSLPRGKLLFHFIHIYK